MKKPKHNNSEKKINRVLILSGHARSLVNFRGPLLKEIKSSGRQVLTAAPSVEEDSNAIEQLQSNGIELSNLEISRTGTSPFHDLRTLVSAYKICRKFRPNLLLAYNIKPVIYGTLAAFIARVPNRYALITGLGYAFTGSATGRRRIIQVFARSLYWLALRKTTHVFFQNPDDRRTFQDLKLLPKSTSSSIVNGSGIDTERFEYFQPQSAPPLIFLMLARLLGDKGVREFVEAAKIIKDQHPDVQFRLAGDLDSNPDAISEHELNQWVDEGIIEYLGRIPDVRPELAKASVYVLPSYREGTPRTVLEAMACGRPVITSDAPGCRETVINGVNGYLVPIKDPYSLAERMRHFIEHPELIKTMGREGRRIAETKYDVRKVNAEMLKTMCLAEDNS